MSYKLGIFEGGAVGTADGWKLGFADGDNAVS